MSTVDKNIIYVPFLYSLYYGSSTKSWYEGLNYCFLTWEELIYLKLEDMENSGIVPILN